jgi:hypothetical protein
MKNKQDMAVNKVSSRRDWEGLSLSAIRKLQLTGICGRQMTPCSPSPARQGV